MSSREDGKWGWKGEGADLARYKSARGIGPSKGCSRSLFGALSGSGGPVCPAPIVWRRRSKLGLSRWTSHDSSWGACPPPQIEISFRKKSCDDVCGSYFVPVSRERQYHVLLAMQQEGEREESLAPSSREEQ